MTFHHIGIATRDIGKTRKWIESHMNVLDVSDEVFDPKQDAYLQMIYTSEVNIELVTGKVVNKIIEKNITYYHICYEVENISKSIHSFQNSSLISPPKEAVLFDNRLVAFLWTPIGVIELLEMQL